MSKIKNSELDQYSNEPFEQQQFGTSGVEGVNSYSYACPRHRVLASGAFSLASLGHETPKAHGRFVTNANRLMMTDVHVRHISRPFILILDAWRWPDAAADAEAADIIDDSWDARSSQLRSWCDVSDKRPVSRQLLQPDAVLAPACASPGLE